jgi:hypothetical protein
LKEETRAKKGIKVFGALNTSLYLKLEYPPMLRGQQVSIKEMVRRSCGGQLETASFRSDKLSPNGQLVAPLQYIIRKP